MVEFNHITKIYDNLISAVYDVSFKLNDGEFVFLIGPSGSGKTTIIKMLIRDELPSQGSIMFNDVDITKISRRKVYKLRREIGVVFQDFKLVPDKTAYENVSFAMEAAGKKNKEIKETVPYVLDIVGLSTRMKSFPRQLSGGEQQRVAIARAIANNPKILIADEPTGNLDPASSWDIVQVLTKINNWGTTVIMSTHGTDIVNSLNKRVVQMDKGRIIRDDNKGQYELVKAYDEEVFEKKLNNSTPRESKKKVYQVKIKNGDTDADSDTDAPKEEASQNKDEVVTKRNPFSKLMSKFKSKNKSAAPISIVETLTNPNQTKPAETKNDKAEVSEPEPEQKPQESKVVEDKPLPVKPEKTKEPEVKEKNLDNAIKKADKIAIDDMNLPKSVKNDLKAAGYKTAQDLINAGPDALAKNLVIDPEEVILISKEIKKLVE